MADGRRMTETNRTFGDAAVDGLLAGAAAGFVMAVYLWVAGLVQGLPTAAVLGRFDPGQSASPLTGALVHLAVSGVYGAIFGLGLRLVGGLPLLRRVPVWVLGTAYGLLLLAVAWLVILPGTGALVREVPLLHLTLAHLLYGVTLGILAGRR